MPHEPAIHATTGSQKAVPKKVPTNEELRATIIHVARSEPWFAVLIRFAAATGARRGEIVALRWADVESTTTGDAIVTFRRRQSRGVTLDGLKTASHKTVTIDATLAADLRARARCAEWVFGRNGAPTSAGTLSRKYKRAAGELGLDLGTFHSLRHFCGSQLFEVTDLSPVQIAAHLGHSRPSTTLDFYAHPVGASEPTASAAIGRLLADG